MWQFLQINLVRIWVLYLALFLSGSDMPNANFYKVTGLHHWHPGNEEWNFSSQRGIHWSRYHQGKETSCRFIMDWRNCRAVYFLKNKAVVLSLIYWQLWVQYGPELLTLEADGHYLWRQFVLTYAVWVDRRVVDGSWFRCLRQTKRVCQCWPGVGSLPVTTMKVEKRT